MNSIYWYGVHPVFPDVTYFLMWLTIYCISRCEVYIVLHTFIAFPVMAYILYILMWRIYYSSELHSNSWYCVTWRAYFLYFLVWRTIHWVSWYDGSIVLQTYTIFPGMANIRLFLCELFVVFLDVAYIASCLLIWSIYCSSDINDIPWYGAQPVFPDVTYFLYLLMWRIYCSSHMHSISYYGVYTVYSDVCTDVASSKLYLLMWRIYYSSEIHSISLYGVHP